MQALIGTGVALATPFKKDLSLDIEALQRIVNFSIDGGIEYLVIMGTTAENATLSEEEKKFLPSPPSLPFHPNLQFKRFWSAEENKWVELRVTPKGMKTINKIGLAEALKRAKANGYIA